MSEHLTDMYQRVLEEANANPMAPLDNVPLTPQIRGQIERWYNDRTFLAKMAKRFYEQAKGDDAAGEDKQNR